MRRAERSEVLGAERRFRVLLDMVFLAYVKNDAIVATTPPFSGQGGVPEIDLGFWLLVGSYEEGKLLPSAIAGVPAYHIWRWVTRRGAPLA